jgi:glycerol uptake facilitator-like aquaporin
MTLSRRIVAEGLGTVFLLAAVVGSGIMGERLAGGNTAIALLANTLATGATLITLIFTFGPISGAHFNPAVTLADASQGGISWSDAPVYIAAQVLGAFMGVAAAHLMFGEALLQFSNHPRAGGGQLFSEPEKMVNNPRLHLSAAATYRNLGPSRLSQLSNLALEGEFVYFCAVCQIEF